MSWWMVELVVRAMEIMATLYEFIKEWQTLIAGLVALAAGLLTVRHMRTQINMQKEQFDEEKRRQSETQMRKEIAARAELPDALSRLCQYTEKCMSYKMSGDQEATRPTAPVDDIAIIKSCIEYVDQQTAEQLFELVRHYQIHNARLSPIRTTAGTSFADAAYDTVYLRGLINNLFEYARDEVDTAPQQKISPEDMVTALKSCVGHRRYYGNEELFNPTMEIINCRHSNTAQP